MADLAWHRIRARGVDANYSGFVAQLDAAAAEPRLRQLFSSNGMWDLCSSSNVDDPSLAETPAAVASPDG
ncbi:DUF6193 family natural product biosynthesis protein [Streptomyces sp. NPDC002911]